MFDSDAYIERLRSKGVRIGNGTIFRGPFSMTIDTSRPSLVTIGENVSFNKGFTLLTHDHVTGVFLKKFDDFIPSSGKVVIGNNVRFGFYCTVLKGVTIGDNCFIAAGSLVTKSIPANSVAAGRPAKVICSIDDYYRRRQSECEAEAFEYARSIKERFNRMPVASDFWEEFPLFVDASNIDKYPGIPIRRQLGSHYGNWLKKHKAKYNGLDEFLAAAGLK